MLVLGPFAASAVYGTFAVTYGIQVGFDRTDVLNAVLVSAAIGLIGQPVFAGLSDLVGRKPVVGVGAVLQALSIFAMFALMDTGDVGMLYLGLWSWPRRPTAARSDARRTPPQCSTREALR